MSISALWSLARPAVFCIDAERAHGLAIQAIKLGFAHPDRTPDDPVLATTVCGLAFTNPIGLAAGFDKQAEVPDAMIGLGFGFAEAGTVTPLPQRGNPKPRVFRLTEDEAVINALGFNSGGLEPFVANLRARRAAGARGLVGANVGKNKTSTDAAADYVVCIRAVTALADYLVVNVSSPNTPGLRALQARAEVQRVIEPVMAARAASIVKGARLPPVFIKIAPDLDDAALTDIAEVALATGVDGLIMGNTTIA
ncbi:MAG: dihydroorotate dehydrogenase (quinone), partial [Burkholderiales bacterium]